jgi:4-oxalocrotonate tautomerase
MPIIEFHLLEGRSVEQKRRLMTQVTQAVVSALDVRPETVRILIHDLPADNFSVAGVSARERATVTAVPDISP